MYKPNTSFAQIARIALNRADAFGKKIPVPAAVEKHFSRKDLAFIAAAYAIPLPGTALFAALMVGIKLGFRRSTNLFKPGATIKISNG